MSVIDNLDTNDLVALLVSSDGDLNLVTERLCKKLSVPFGSINEYEIQARIANLDIQTTDIISAKLRTLLIIKLYNLIHTATIRLQACLGELRPSELARTHASLIASFSSLTAPSTKITFDFEHEIESIAEMLNIPKEEIRGDLKEMENKLKAVK